MLDDFREQASTSPFFEEVEEKPKPAPRPRYFLGMAPAQRFVIALMLLLIVCILGSFALLVTNKIVLPFI